MKIFSNSRLSCYENCPRQFKFKYIDEIDPPEPFESIEQFLGLRVHDALEAFYQQLMQGQMLKQEELLSLFEDQWDQQFHGAIKLIKKGISAQDFKLNGRRALAHYYKRYQPFQGAATLGNEIQINFPLGRYQITGFIDRLDQREDGTYEIHDYKTSSRLPSKKYLLDERQLAFYHLGIQEQFDAKCNADLVWHYLLFDKEIRVNKNHLELNQIKEATLQLIHTIEQDNTFLPKESPLCNWCEYAPICPTKLHGAKVRALPMKEYHQDEGVYLVYRYHQLTQRMERLKKKHQETQKVLNELEEEILNFANKHQYQCLQGDDAKIAINKRKCITFPGINHHNEELKTWLVEKGAWNELSTLDVQKIRQYLLSNNGDPEIKRKLLEYAETYEMKDIELKKSE